MDDYLKIRYTELRFTVRFIEDSVLPRFKSSAIRGGLGNRLLEEYCIRDAFRNEHPNNCNKCDFADECIVQRIMYSKMDIMPSFMSSGNSVGYIVECRDMKEEFVAGDSLDFKLVLFGKAIVYFSQYLSAIYRLGMSGLGRNEARFEVISVKNVYNEDIMSGNNIFKENYRIESVSKYVDYRMERLTESGIPDQVRIKLNSPLAIKKDGDILRKFDITAFVRGLNRRLYVMNCYEGWEYSELLQDDGMYPEVLNAESRFTKIPRYSFRKSEKIFLEGIYGSIDINLDNNPDNFMIRSDILRKLLAGEILRVGSNTSFGFGGYRVERLL